MLELTDEALARLAIGATAVEAKDRARWLADITARLEGRAPRSPAAERQRRYRANAAAGFGSLQLKKIDLDTLEFMLEKLGLLPADAEHTRKDIALAYSRWTSDWLAACRAETHNAA